MKVKEVITIQNKTSKAGKAYTLSTFKVDDPDHDEEINAFGEAKVGMEVTELQFNDEYNQWQAKLALPNRHDELMTALRELYKKVNESIELAKETKKTLESLTKSGYEKAKETRKQMEPDWADEAKDVADKNAMDFDESQTDS